MHNTDRVVACLAFSGQSEETARGLLLVIFRLPIYRKRTVYSYGRTE